MIKTAGRKLAEARHNSASQNERLIGRRVFIAAIAAIPAIIAFGYAETTVLSDASGNSPDPDASGIVKVSIVEFTDSGQRKGLVMEDKVVKTDEEWRKELTPEQYESRAKRAPGARSQTCTPRITTRVCIDASAAATRCSARTPSLNRARDGRASISRSRRRTSRR